MSIPAVVSRAPRSLMPGILVGDVVDMSRAALVAFLRLKEGAPDRRELAVWLFGPYSDAIRIGRAPGALQQQTMPLVDDAFSDETPAERIASAIGVIERVLVSFYGEPDLSIAAALVEQRVLEPVIDDRGATGFAPLGDDTTPLNVRVLAIAAAEMLTRPDRLRADLIVNGTAVEIADRPVASGVGMRRETLPWTPLPDERDRVPGWPAALPTLAELVAAQDGATEPDDSKK